MEHIGISTSAVLVDLGISTWTARKLDKKVSEEIDVTKGTTARAGNYHKKLFAGDSILDEMNKFVTQVRTYHYQVTLPWTDGGTRLLPMGKFMEYNTQIQTYEAEFNSYKQQFVDKYNEMVSSAAFTLGEMFNRADYPEPEEVMHKFNFKYDFSPVPQSGDFRIDIESEGKNELIKNFEDKFEKRIAEAMKDAWVRLHECLSRMSERLDFANGETKKIFRDSLVDNAIELVDLLKSLNITKDPELETLRKKLEQAMFGISAKELRDDGSLRKQVKSEVDSILSKISL
jgi:hypothetical protein